MNIFKLVTGRFSSTEEIRSCFFLSIRHVVVNIVGIIILDIGHKFEPMPFNGKETNEASWNGPLQRPCR